MTLHDPDHIPPGPGAPLPRPLATTSVVIYATLILLAITVPRGLVNWSKNFEPSTLQAVSLHVAQAVQSLSQRIGLDQPYLWGREEFLKAAGKRDD